MDNFVNKQSFETKLLNPINTDSSSNENDKIGTNQKRSVIGTNIIIEDDYGHIKVT